LRSGLLGVTYKIPLSQAPHGYEIFKHKEDDCLKSCSSR